MTSRFDAMDRLVDIEREIATEGGVDRWLHVTDSSPDNVSWMIAEIKRLRKELRLALADADLGAHIRYLVTKRNTPARCEYRSRCAEIVRCDV